jgi:hypothetical protein
VEAQGSHSSHFPATGICGQGKKQWRLKFPPPLDYILRASSLSELVMLVLFIIYCIFILKLLLQEDLKSNLLSPLKLLVPGASNLKRGQ